MWPWIGIVLFILMMLAVDLGLFNRRPHVISMKEALSWFGVWVGLALIFNIGVVFFHERGLEAGLEFFAGFLVEKSLSIDNVFVFVLIFNYFQVPLVHQHKVSVERIILNLRADSMDAAVELMIAKLSREELSADPKVIPDVVLSRNQFVPIDC